MVKTDLTDYGKRIKSFAVNEGLDFFFSLIPERTKKDIAICLDREKGYSYRRMAKIHSQSKSTIERTCKTCPTLLNKSKTF